MKNFFVLLVVTLVLIPKLLSQSPQGFNYQAVIRDNTGSLIVNQDISLKINILAFNRISTPVYSETHSVYSDDFGQVNLVVGHGSVNQGVFSEIDWSLGTYYLDIELDYNGNGYIPVGSTQLLSVPYALYASSSGYAETPDYGLSTLLAENNSANNQQIKNLLNPTEMQDAVTLSTLLEKTTMLQNQIDELLAIVDPGEITDQNGNIYPYLKYGDQIWTISNAAMTTYEDGTPIPEVRDSSVWNTLTTGAWCYYNNDPTNGKLYNWYAVAGIHDTDPATPNKKLAPYGWDVPSDKDWNLLEQSIINVNTCTYPNILTFECNNPSISVSGIPLKTVSYYDPTTTTYYNTHAGEVLDDGTNSWDALIIDYERAIDLIDNNVFRLKFRSPKKSVQILAKLEGGTAQEIWSDFSLVNTWETFSFDFSDSVGKGNTKLVLFFNAGKSNGNESDIYYIDHLQWFDGNKVQFPIAKSMSAQKRWLNSNIQGTPGNDLSSNNSSGFNALPEGSRGTFFSSRDEAALFWTRTTNNNNNNNTSLSRGIYYNTPTLLENDYQGSPKRLGLSVRFIKK